MQIQFQSYNLNFSARTVYPRIQKPDLLKCIQEGCTQREICEKFNVTPQVVCRSLNWYGLKSSRAIEREENIKNVMDLYDKGYSVKEIRKELAIKTDTIKRIIKNHEKPEHKDKLLESIMNKLNLGQEDVNKYLK